MSRKMLLPAIVAMSVAATGFAQTPTQRQATPQQNLQQNQENRQQQRLERRDQRGVEQRGVQIGERRESASANTLENTLAQCLLWNNDAEIEMAQFALQNTQNPQVKQFAQTLVQDHQQYGQKLRQFLGQTTTAQEDTQQFADKPQPQDRRLGERARDARDALQERREERQEARDEQGRPGQIGERIQHRAAYPPGDQSIVNQLMMIDQQAIENCTEMAKSELQQHQGDEFDKAFVGMQIGMHMGLLAHMQAADQHVSGEFKQLLQEGQQTVKQHKQQAEQLKEQLMSSTGASNTRQPATQP